MGGAGHSAGNFFALQGLMEDDEMQTTSHAVTECRKGQLQPFEYMACNDLRGFLSFFQISFGYRSITFGNTLQAAWLLPCRFVQLDKSNECKIATFAYICSAFL